jgi:hypothetical protein
MGCEVEGAQGLGCRVRRVRRVHRVRMVRRVQDVGYVRIGCRLQS